VNKKKKIKINYSQCRVIFNSCAVQIINKVIAFVALQHRDKTLLTLVDFNIETKFCSDFLRNFFQIFFEML
jgi:hypothetical protein